MTNYSNNSSGSKSLHYFLAEEPPTWNARVGCPSFHFSHPTLFHASVQATCDQSRRVYKGQGFWSAYFFGYQWLSNITQSCSIRTNEWWLFCRKSSICGDSWQQQPKAYDNTRKQDKRNKIIMFIGPGNFMKYLHSVFMRAIHEPDTSVVEKNDCFVGTVRVLLEHMPVSTTFAEPSLSNRRMYYI